MDPLLSQMNPTQFPQGYSLISSSHVFQAIYSLQFSRLVLHFSRGFHFFLNKIADIFNNSPIVRFDLVFWLAMFLDVNSL